MKKLSERTRTAGALLVAAALAAAGGCHKGVAAKDAKGKGGAAAAKVMLVAVEKRPVERTVEITGTLLGQEEATISSKVSGRIVAIVRDLGDVAMPGEVLARIDPKDFELAVAERRATVSAALAKVGLTALPAEPFDAAAVPTVQRARAEASNADAKLERASRLFEQTPPLLSAQDFADIRTTRDVAKSQAEVELMTARATLAEARAQAAAVDVAEQKLRDAMVTAPGANGDAAGARRYRVAERMVSEGEYVTEGRQLFKLVSSDVVKLRAHAPEKFSGSIKPGQRASVQTESAVGAVEGKVTRVAPAADPASRAFAVEIEVANGEGQLKPGAFARGRIVTSVEEGVSLVPTSAVVSFAGVDRVFSVKDGKAVEHRVKLGQRVGELVEVVGGLTAVRIVGVNASGLTPGVAVEVSEGTTEALRTKD